jgi:putative membrane protein
MTNAYLYIKAIHIIFIVTWFAGLFYMPRFFIYNTEAESKPAIEREILRAQFGIMMKRLWYGITWPSAILTLIFGITVWALYKSTPGWLQIKLVFVFFLYVYHISLHLIFRQQMKGVFKYTSQQLRIWNEAATIFLIVIVMIVVVKQNISAVWGIAGLILLAGVLFSAVKVYKLIRDKSK